jgi:hypothetical protein
MYGFCMNRLKKFFSDNGLLLIFVALFLACLVGQALSGLSLYNETQSTHGVAQSDFWPYLTTGGFLQGAFANWQAAILQLGSLIIFGIFLRQRGAAHSLKPGSSGATRKRPLHAFRAMRKSTRKGTAKTSRHKAHDSADGRGDWLHDNSLSIAFVLLFLITFLLHLFSGEAAFNHQRAFNHQPALTAAQFFVSSQFWFTTQQTWEAEYMAIALYIFLSIDHAPPIAAPDFGVAL